jgi:hypothetical protein
MSERVFTITMNDAKRLTALHALGFMYCQMHNAPTVILDPIRGMIDELTKAQGAEPGQVTVDQSEQTVRMSPLPYATARPTPVTKLDYFQRDRKGVAPTIAPTGAELMTVNVVAATEKPIKNGRALEVIYNVAGKGGKAKCFDASLWPYITPRQGQTAELWILESGNYLNIVGVRA